MSRSFNLTAELNLRGPANIRPVIANIRRQLSGITADVNVNINNNTTRNVNNLQQSINRLNTSLNATQNAARNAAASLSAFGRAAAAANNNIGNIPRNLNRINAGAGNVNNTLTQTNRTLNQTATGFEEFGRQSALAVRRFAAFATVTGVIYKFTNALSSATSEFIGFNKELVRVAQVTDSSLSQLSPLVKEITSLSTGLGIASKDLITVSSTLAQAGLTAKDTEKALKALALSALAPSFDSLSDTVEGSIALMRQFGISAGQLEDALGSVNAVAAKFAVEASDLITAIQRTGGVFATASRGVSEGKDALNEFLAVFTSVRATTRESAETIATGLRTIFTRIQRKDTIDALKQYGVTLTDLEGKFVGPYEAVRRLSDGLSKLDPRDLRFSQIVEELGGFRQIGKVIPLIQQFATAQAALKVAQQGQGSLAKDAATAQLSLANQITKVREEFTALIRSLGESATFQTFVRLSLDLASALIRLADSAKTVLPALTAIAAFRGVSALTRFGAGFAGGLRRQNNGGFVRGFATGGVVPGEGNSDTFPAMLTPGEFVIRKNAVKAIGVGNLHRMNRYANGGQAKDTLQNYYRGDFDNTRFSRKKDLSKTERSQLAKETKDLRSLGTSAPKQLYSSISRSAFDMMAMQTGLNKNPAIPKGTNFFDQEKYYSQETMKIIGKSFRLPGFVSTSKDFAKAKIFLDNAERSEDNWAAMMNIKTKKGAKGVDVVEQLKGTAVRGGIKKDNITGQTLYQNPPESEDEFILRPGSKFRVDKTKFVKLGVNKNLWMDVEQFAKGGFANAPLVDDITSNAAGAMLPNKIALDKILASGYGALDFDRTLKRTVGDAAYGKAKTSGQKDAVLSKYFRDPTNRLEDAKNARLTQFGRMLQKSIQDGQVNPSNLSIISKSKRTPGLAEYINELFGIPIGNMIFTGGGSKQEAYDAMRSKGPRASRVSRFINGGGVTAGKINSAFKQQYSSSKIRSMSKEEKEAKKLEIKKLLEKNSSQVPLDAEQQAGIPVGLVGLYGTPVAGAPKITPKGNKVTVWGGVLPSNFSSQYEDDIIKGFQDSISRVGSSMAQQIGAVPQTGPVIEKIMKDAGVEGVIGAALEGAIGVAGNPYSSKEFKAIDFSQGLSTKLASLFGIPPMIPTDATRTVGDTGKKGERGKGIPKFLNQVDRFLFAENPNLVPAVKTKTRKRKATGGGISGQDTVPALLTPGEFVINKKAASRIGASRLHQLNRADKIQGFNKGGSVGGIQKFAAGGFPAQLTPALGGLSPKDTAKLSKAIMDNVDAFNVLESMVSGLPTDQMLKAMRIFTSKLEKGASDINAAATEAATLAQSGGGGSRQGKKVRVANAGSSPPVGPPSPTNLATGTTESRPVRSPVGPTGFAASQARIDQIASNVGQYQRGQDVVDRRSNVMGMTSGVSNMSNAGLQFAASLKSATNPLQMLTQAAKNAGTGLLQVGKSSIMAAGRGAGGLISSIGGGALNAIGLGRFASGGRGAGGAGGGGGFGMAGMALTMVGGLGVDAISKAMGGEKTEAGRSTAAIGGSVANMASIGATVGSMFGPLGTGIGAATGALAGFVMGIGEAEKANEEYAQSQKIAASQTATDKSGKALQAYMTNPGNVTGRNSFLKSFSDASSAEASAGAGIKRQRASTFGKMFGYADETAMDAGKRRADTQKSGADQAQQFLVQEMMRTGKTFDQVSKTMSPDQFKMLTSNIAEADERYATFQIQRADEIKKLRDSGRGAEADALQAETNKELAVMSESIAKRSLAEASAAAQAKAAAEASKKLSVVMMQAVVSLEKSFNAMEEVLNRSSFELGEIGNKADEIFSGKASLTSSTLSRTNNVLQNPNAYSAGERQAAITNSAARMGTSGQLVGKVAEFGARATEQANRDANAVYNAGGSNEDIGGSVTRSLTNNILATFGPNSSMAQTLVAGVRNTVDEAVKQANEAGTTIDPSELIDKAAGPLNKAAQQAGQLLIKNNENVAKHLDELGKVAERVVEIEQRRADRTSALIEMQAQSGLSTKEALGQKVSIGERINARFAGNRARLGIQNQGDFTPQNIANMRSRAQKEQQALQAQIDRKSSEVSVNPAAAKEVANLQLKLAKVNSTIDKTTKELENLPGALEGAISDVTSEMQKRVSQLESQKQASGAFAEKLVGSTPQELMELSQTFNLLNSTLSGQITTIQQSQVAQQAYVQAIQQGKTAQEAMSDAQTAFANENKKALGLFGELTQIAGVDGPELDVMKADLLENFARAQGAGLERNPFFQKLLATLRQNPEDRAKNDPVLKALQARMDELKNAQVEAVRLQNENDRNIQKDLLEKVGKSILDSLAKTQEAFVKAMNDVAIRLGAAPQGGGGRGFATGGLVYAANGKYVNFVPKGTDTIPAMLSPGEFVVNAKSTKDNLSLLTAINNSRGGKINYLAAGGQPDLSGVSERTDKAKQQDMARSGLINQTVLSNKIDSVKGLSQTINSTTLSTKNNQIPSLDTSIDKNQTTNNQQFSALGRNLNRLSETIKGSRALSTGGIVYAADGKYINFQPKGTDTIPAMLSPGEFVVNAKSTKDNLGVLQAINSGYYADGGRLGGVDPSPLNFQRSIVSQRFNRAFKKAQPGDYVILTPRGDYVGEISGVQNIREASLRAKEEVNGYKPGIDRIIPKINYLVGQEQSKNFGEKLVAELQDQMMEAPNLFGPDAFNTTLNDREKVKDIFSKINQGANIGELYRKATKRENYLRQVQNNTSLGIRLGRGAPTFNTQDGKMQYGKNTRLLPAEVLGVQNKRATEEITAINRVWGTIKNGVKWDGTKFENGPPPEGLRRDSSTVFDALNPSSLPDRSYFNKGGVIYVEGGSYIPFKTPRDKALNDRRVANDKEMERRRNQADIDQKSKMVLSTWDPIWKKEDAQKAKEDARKRFEEEKARRKGANPTQDELKFFADWRKEEASFLAQDKKDQAKRSYEQEKIRRFNNPTLSPAQYRKRGGTIYANGGTIVPYQPKGTDTVPAMLSPGEFVVNRQASQKHLGLLQSINNGYYSKGGVAYLADGTQGTSALDSNMTYLSDILKKGAESLNLAFMNAVKKLNNLSETGPDPTQVRTNGVSNNQINPSVSIEALGNRLDRFIEQLQNAIPSTVTLEVPSPIPVNVTINGASVLADVLNGPLGNLVQRAIRDAFDQKSRQNEGY